MISGTGYYRWFIQDFSKLAQPLHCLTEQNHDFIWTSGCQLAFQKLKECLCSPPSCIIRTTPSLSSLIQMPVIVELELFCLCLMMREMSIRFLSKPERRYCVTRRELLAVVMFTEHFRPFLIGCKFTPRTDHGSLTWLRNFKDPEGQMA